MIQISGTDIFYKNVGSEKGGEAFLFKGKGVNFLLDTGYGFAGKATVKNLEMLLNGEKLDCVLLSHSHYDHCMGLPYILEKYPDARVFGSARCGEVLIKDSARSVMRRMDTAAAEFYGRESGEDLTPRLALTDALEDGEEFALGEYSVKAVAQPGHTRCCMGFYFSEEKLMLGSETLGLFAGGLNSLPTFLVGADIAVKSIEATEKTDIDRLFVSHYGMLYGSDVKDFLENSRKASLEEDGIIREMLRKGASDGEIEKSLTEKYYPKDLSEYYPFSAFIVNTRAQIAAVRKSA